MYWYGSSPEPIYGSSPNAKRHLRADDAGERAQPEGEHGAARAVDHQPERVVRHRGRLDAHGVGCLLAEERVVRQPGKVER